MLSFRTIFALATSFAALSSAAPIVDGISQVTQVVNVKDVANSLLQDVQVSDIHVNALSIDRRQIGQTTHLVNVKNNVNDAVHHVTVSDVEVEVLNVHRGLVKREGPKPIAAILLRAKAELEATNGKLNVIVKGKVEVNLDDVKDIIDEAHATLATALASVQAIVGQSAVSILNHNGKLWSAAEVGTLLISVVVNVFHILYAVLSLVASASHKAASVQVNVIVEVLSDLLLAIFVRLDVGIFAATRPQLTAALIKAWTSLRFDTVVAILESGQA